MNDADLELLNGFQRNFPLTSQPFRAIAERLGWSEAEVLTTLRRLTVEGKVSRVGAVFATRRLGVSTLAALAVPPARLEAVAQWVNDYPEVNHNYQREHHFNLWFVLTVATASRLQGVLADIEAKTGLPILNLPMLEEFHIDLGFDLRDGGRATTSPAPRPGSNGATLMRIDAADQGLLAALQPGLPLVSRPFHSLGQPLGWSEQQVIERLRHWLEQGVIRRMGVIVRHRALGYQANAMVVWDVPDAEVSRVGRMLAAESGVNLCYRRPRRLPHWPYNLFCMMHGRQQAHTLERVEQLRQARRLMDYPHAVLFSTRCFRQRGAYYLPAAASSKTALLGGPSAAVGQFAWTS
ncbi:MAG: AsnC family transcriptional regulator [Candidatus Contendobacter sp.]|jgi:DNA-binding Lrp family transcriptional regulator|nr:AsnC family transcriptional regulator [Candidatus Contendobacter sp.]